jgi:outer membrane murein-binding lipoprotein Lpp
MIRLNHRLTQLAAPFALVCLAHATVSGQNNTAIELMEAKTALEYSNARIAELEQSLAKAQSQATAYGESLAAANNELEQTRESYDKLRIQMEGLGVSALDPTGAELQQTLLTALSDLRILEQQKRQLADALLGLSESALTHTNAPGDAAARQSLEQRLADAEKALVSLRGEAQQESTGNLQNASIVSLKDELGIAVLNVGSKHGVHPGMPFAIYRQDKPVARALVVDVRSGVSGAIVQELVNPNDRVKVGDVGKVETEFKG